jgi:hypothetical protein
MRFVLLLILQLLTNVLFCQVTKPDEIDSIVKKIELIEYFYRADSNAYVFDKDSNLLASSSMEFSYIDRKGKNLFKVDELGFITDTTSTIFYFKNRQLIKIDFHSLYNGKTFQAELFYNKGQLIGRREKGNLVYQLSYSSFYYRSIKYLKYKPKLVSQNWIN